MKPLRTLITPVVMAALAVTSFTAAPARASNDDLAKLLIGLGAIAIIANSADGSKKSSAVTYSTRSNRVVTLPEDRKPRYKKRYALPKDCLRTYSARNGDRKLYSGRCLDRLPYRLAKLPDACAYTVMGRKGVRGKAYGPRCMSRNGFHHVETIAQARNQGRHIVYGN